MPLPLRVVGTRVHARVPTTATAEHGQATVEFALVLPLVFALLVLLFQVALVARDEILVVHAARDAAREASVTHDPARRRRGRAREPPGREVRVVRRGRVGEPVEVEITYVRAPTCRWSACSCPTSRLHARSVMRVETP